MKITALLIIRQERRQALSGQLEASGVEVLPAETCSEARRILRTRPAIDVVLTGARLPDGDWCRVLGDVAQSRVHAKVVICPRLADAGLWCEALGRGAYDLVGGALLPGRGTTDCESSSGKESRRGVAPQPAGGDRSSRLKRPLTACASCIPHLTGSPSVQ